MAIWAFFQLPTQDSSPFLIERAYCAPHRFPPRQDTKNVRELASICSNRLRGGEAIEAGNHSVDISFRSARNPRFGGLDEIYSISDDPSNALPGESRNEAAAAAAAASAGQRLDYIRGMLSDMQRALDSSSTSENDESKFGDVDMFDELERRRDPQVPTAEWPNYRCYNCRIKLRGDYVKVWTGSGYKRTIRAPCWCPHCGHRQEDLLEKQKDALLRESDATKEERLIEQMQPAAFRDLQHVAIINRLHDWKRALELHDEMLAVVRVHCLRPDTTSFRSAIFNCQCNGRWREAIRLMEEMRSFRITPHLEVFNSAIQACSAGNEWRHALSLFEELQDVRLVPDVVSFTAASEACSGAATGPHQWQRALRLHEEMRAALVQPNGRNLHAALVVCSRSSQWQEALQVFSDMEERRFTPNADSHQLAISACKELGRWEQALELLDRMPKKHVEQYLDCCGDAITTCGSAGQWQAAVSVLKEMQTHATPNAVCFRSAMLACIKAGQFQNAKSVLDEMHQMGTTPGEMAPDEHVHLVAYVKHLQATHKALCQAWYDHVHALGGGKNDPAHYEVASLSKFVSHVESILPAVCEEGGDWQQLEAGQWRSALSVLDDMKQIPSEISFNAALSACERGVQWQHALALLADMRLAEVTPTSVSLNTVVSACEKGAQWKVALALLEDIKASSSSEADIEEASEPTSDLGVSAQVASFNAAMSECKAFGQWQRALSLLQEMRSARVQVDEKSFAMAISACERGDEWEHAVSLLEDMREALITPNVMNYGAAIATCAKAGRLEQVMLLLEDLESNGLRIQKDAGVNQRMPRAKSQKSTQSESLDPLADIYNALHSQPQSSKTVAKQRAEQPTGGVPDRLSDNLLFNYAVIKVLSKEISKSQAAP